MVVGVWVGLLAWSSEPGEEGNILRLFSQNRANKSTPIWVVFFSSEEQGPSTGSRPGSTVGEAFPVGYIKWMLSEKLILINVFCGKAQYQWILYCISKGIGNRDLNRYLYTHVHNSIIYIAKMWKRPKCLPAGEWINKLCSIHIMECYLAIKRNENLINGGRDRDEQIKHRGFGRQWKYSIWYSNENICHFTCVQTYRMYNIRSEP